MEGLSVAARFKYASQAKEACFKVLKTYEKAVEMSLEQEFLRLDLEVEQHRLVQYCEKAQSLGLGDDTTEEHPLIRTIISAIRLFEAVVTDLEQYSVDVREDEEEEEEGPASTSKPEDAFKKKDNSSARGAIREWQDSWFKDSNASSKPKSEDKGKQSRYKSIGKKFSRAFRSGADHTKEVASNVKDIAQRPRRLKWATGQGDNFKRFIHHFTIINDRLKKLIDDIENNSKTSALVKDVNELKEDVKKLKEDVNELKKTLQEGFKTLQGDIESLKLAAASSAAPSQAAPSPAP